MERIRIEQHSFLGTIWFGALGELFRRMRGKNPERRHHGGSNTAHARQAARGRMILAISVVVACLSLAASAGFGQEPIAARPVQIPAGATSLEGTPTVRIDSAEGATARRVLDAAEAAKARLSIRIVDGRFYWTTRDNRLLRLNASGEFTYLSSEPGQYIRLTRLNDKISYVEHVDLASGSVTWFGELKIVIGK